MEDFDDTEFVGAEHDRLISAISKLDKTQHITEPTRSEPSTLNSEFGLVKRTKRIDLSNVAKVLGDTNHHLGISKKLKKTEDGSKVLSKPLEKPQAERIKRATGYEETKKQIGRWDPVVARNRTVDFVSFPLRSVEGKLKKQKPTTEFLARFTLKSQLEKELDEIDPPAVEEDVEEETTYPMSYEEMLEHRQQLAKIRAQQSYKAAKAKRQSKIKSKKYHRILKKEKLKLQLKEFEELQKTDPEEALKKLETLEKSRALERHTLRHKNTGKWAKNKLVRAKYDKEVRQELAEQLAVSRGLTKKIQDTESTDDEIDNDEIIPDITLSQDPSNPWMMKRSDKSNVDAEFDFGYKKYVQNKQNNDESDSDDSDQDDKVDLELIKENIVKLNDSPSKPAKKEVSHDEKEIPLVQERKIQIKPVKKAKSHNKLIATSNWNVELVDSQVKESKKTTDDVISAFESLDDKLTKQVTSKLKRLRDNDEKIEKSKSKKSKSNNEDTDNLEYLKLRNKKVKAVIDEALIETTRNTEPQLQTEEKSISKLLTSEETSSQQPASTNIDPSRFIAVKPKHLVTALPNGSNEFDQLDDEEDQMVPRVNIEEVFEEDDVVANFRQEKEDEANNDNPENIDFSLPGWGSWGGKGVKAPRRKRNRFILKAPPKEQRRDENKGDIIIKEYKDPKLASHKVTDVPFPFTSIKDFEASIRAPLGNTFITEKAHKQLIKPSVITKAGAVIEPMTQDELLSKRNQTFKNESVIKLLGQK